VGNIPIRGNEPYQVAGVTLAALADGLTGSLSAPPLLYAGVATGIAGPGTAVVMLPARSILGHGCASVL